MGAYLASTDVESTTLIHQNLLKCLVAPNGLQDAKQGYHLVPNADLCLSRWTYFSKVLPPF